MYPQCKVGQFLQFNTKAQDFICVDKPKEYLTYDNLSWVVLVVILTLSILLRSKKWS